MEVLKVEDAKRVLTVLILIVMEDTHGVDKNVHIDKIKNVLILIVMEDTHGGARVQSAQRWKSCLNPYCNGRYSWSIAPSKYLNRISPVLILIVMEDTHGEFSKCSL